METTGTNGILPDVGTTSRRRSLLVLYGSETGNAQDIAEELGRVGERLHFQTTVDEMGNVKLNEVLKNHALVIFVISTTGQGAFPENSLHFWKSLRRAKLPPNCLASVDFTTFGLGDSSYAKFNWAGRQLQSRLEKLGAREAFPFGEGDERHNEGIDSIYQPWLENFRSHILKTFPLPEGVEPIPEDQPLLPKFILHLEPPSFANMEIQKIINSPEELLSDDEKQFLVNREKCAADSHVDKPRSRAEQVDADWSRLNSGVALLARMGEAECKSVLRTGRVEMLDKLNVLKDHHAKYLLEDTPKDADDRLPPIDHLTVPSTYKAVVEINHQMTPSDHWQDVRFIELSVAIGPQSMHLALRPGDAVQIYPKNFPDDVDALIDRMKWDEFADKPVKFSSIIPDEKDKGNCVEFDVKPPGLYPPKKATLRALLLNNYDITAVPKRSFLEKISFFTSNDDHKERLRELISPGGSQEFYDYTSRPRRTILEILSDFHSVMIPFHRVPDMFPLIRPREFSIANCGRSFVADVPDAVRIELLAALVEYKTLIRKPRQGLCSRYLKTLPEFSIIDVGFKVQNRAPSGDMYIHRPLIAIATGTGIAPIRAIIQDRDEYVDPEETLLFFGCRNEKADFYYQQEWQKLDHVTCIPAFSRDAMPDEQEWNDPYSKEPALLENVETGGSGIPPTSMTHSTVLGYDYDRGKNYVQHQIRRHADKVCALIKRQAVVVICGNAGQMPSSVRKALADAAVLGGLCKTFYEAVGLFDGSNGTPLVPIWEETW